MDTIGSAQVAEALGTTVARIDRAARGGLAGADRDARGRWRFSQGAVGALRRRWGVVPGVAGLTRAEALVLAALTRRPRGLASARAAAAVAGLAPTTASRALRRLERAGLAEQVEDTRARNGRATRVTVWWARLLAPGIDPIRGSLREVVLPERARETRAHAVPPRVRHLFWQGDPRLLDPDLHGPHIARRVLAARDPEADAWASTVLRPTDWAAAAAMRGLDPAERRTAKARAAR